MRVLAQKNKVGIVRVFHHVIALGDWSQIPAWTTYEAGPMTEPLITLAKMSTKSDSPQNFVQWERLSKHDVDLTTSDYTLRPTHILYDLEQCRMSLTSLSILSDMFQRRPHVTQGRLGMNECFYFRVIKNWLRASLVLHTRRLKEDNGKTTTKC